MSTSSAFTPLAPSSQASDVGHAEARSTPATSLPKVERKGEDGVDADLARTVVGVSESPSEDSERLRFNFTGRAVSGLD